MKKSLSSIDHPFYGGTFYVLGGLHRTNVRITLQYSEFKPFWRYTDMQPSFAKSGTFNNDNCFPTPVIPFWSTWMNVSSGAYTPFSITPFSSACKPCYVSQNFEKFPKLRVSLTRYLPPSHTLSKGITRPKYFPYTNLVHSSIFVSTLVLSGLDRGFQKKKKINSGKEN